MKKNNVTCPACNSKNLERHETTSKDHITLGSEFTYQEIYYHCKDCSDEFDIFNETEKNFQEAEHKANKVFANSAIEYFAKNGVSMALFERVFELPTRTLNRWKEGNISASALSLLRVLIVYPWIIKVAEKKYSSESTKKELIYAATNTFVQCAANYTHAFHLEIAVKSADTTFVNINTIEATPRVAINKEFVRAAQ